MLKSLRFAVLIAGVTLGYAAMAAARTGRSRSAARSGRSVRSIRSAHARQPSFYVHGAVSSCRRLGVDWVEAQLNRPLVTGDKLWTNNGSRAELEIGSAAMRMDAQTSFDFRNLDDNAAQVELTQVR